MLWQLGSAQDDRQGININGTKTGLDLLQAGRAIARGKFAKLALLNLTVACDLGSQWTMSVGEFAGQQDIETTKFTQHEHTESVAMSSYQSETQYNPSRKLQQGGS